MDAHHLQTLFILSRLEGEPRSVAQAMDQMETAEAGLMLSLIQSEEVAARTLGHLKRLDPKQVFLAMLDTEGHLELDFGAIGQKIAEQLANIPSKGQVERYTLILRLLGPMANELEKELQGVSSGLAQEVAKNFLGLNALLKLDPNEMQSLLSEVRHSTWIIILPLAPLELRERVFNNLSERAARMLKEDMEAIGSVSQETMEKAFLDLYGVLERLKQKGRILWREREGGVVRLAQDLKKLNLS